MSHLFVREIIKINIIECVCRIFDLLFYVRNNGKMSKLVDNRTLKVRDFDDMIVTCIFNIFVFFKKL